MTPSLIAFCLVLLAVTSLAFLPVRRQSAPGIVIWVGLENGWGGVLAGLLAFALPGRNGVMQIPRLIRGKESEILDA